MSSILVKTQDSLQSRESLLLIRAKVLEPRVNPPRCESYRIRPNVKQREMGKSYRGLLHQDFILVVI